MLSNTEVTSSISYAQTGDDNFFLSAMKKALTKKEIEDYTSKLKNDKINKKHKEISVTWWLPGWAVTWPPTPEPTYTYSGASGVLEWNFTVSFEMQLKKKLRLVREKLKDKKLWLSTRPKLIILEASLSIILKSLEFLEDN